MRKSEVDWTRTVGRKPPASRRRPLTKAAQGALFLAALVVASPVQAADPLPSWRDDAARRSIVAFVEDVTSEGGASYVPPAERIAAIEAREAKWGVTET